ncbi:aminomethyl-transferring glycine dehydrogenase subunit GcvPA [Oceanispirochaeta sp.]|jgi:glycine dehydrogenase subunit 1|uniref:aminomethyl-transferring glycine dehydrogenase subunit GcvPA n=1 Tax=Oceanispirochaeta sp. TaxID=2035350 RepID=UPI00262308B0|nr:aminomethyl-transferring glycine dehydrogenase subunit GcvPA [Oceanispirochaeta sp.]MDA3957412.1 aminomethyl-transferring glycine dehydrogenase subunit GcvPA [Oceanispirochaeta sp.]
MSYIPHTADDRRTMLETLGLSTVKDLFTDIPEAYRYPELKIPDGLSEMDVKEKLSSLARKNHASEEGLWFLGGGLYRHFIPSVVDAVLSRGEFFSAYTPYQPEVSQGTLQAVFEFQTMVAELYGMDVVNASHYDGAASMAEAALMARRCKPGRNTIYLDEGIHPEYKEVLQTYLTGTDALLKEGPPGEDAACFITAYPGFTGEIKDLKSLGNRTHEAGALFIVHADPLACGILESPGACGADIVTGEGQPLGIPMSFGGPTLGLFATTKALIRKMPGRVVGQTMDASGRAGCVLTFSAREQHIRREKATSNICSNQGLLALAAAVYMAALGKQGIRETAQLIYNKGVYAASVLGSLEGFKVKTEGPFFREFVLTCPRPAREIADELQKKGIFPGLALDRFDGFPENDLLVCVTEMNSKDDIDSLAAALGEVSR